MRSSRFTSSRTTSDSDRLTLGSAQLASVCSFRAARAQRSTRGSGLGTAEPAALLKDVRFTVDREDHRALVAAGLVHRAGFAPDELAGTSDPFMVVEGAFEDPGLLDLRMLVDRQPRAGRPLEEAGHLAFREVLVEHLDGDAFELGGLPLHLPRLGVRRAVRSGFQLPRLHIG